MKHAIFTQFVRQRWLSSRQLFLMFIFTWGLLGVRYLPAQIVATYDENENTSNSVVLDNCEPGSTTDSVLFRSDQSYHYLYGDSRPRMDTVEICPSSSDYHVKTTFKDFDLEMGDTLFAYDGNKEAFRNGDAPVIGTGAGNGASRAYGGWLDASCNPKENPSGCLTFLFKTDGDHNKGSGWEAWVECGAKDYTLAGVDIRSRTIECDGPAYSVITFPAPAVLACGDTLPVTADSVLLVIRDKDNRPLKDTILTYNGVDNSYQDTFAIGTYIADYTLLCDPNVRLREPFFIQAPALVCNDRIFTSFGSACVIELHPDDILESTCDTIADTMYYNITVIIGTGKNQIIKETRNLDSHAAVDYPEITIDDLRAAGMSACNAEAKVIIERVYYQLGGTATICNNGVQRSSCHTFLDFSDYVPPFIEVTKQIDALIGCDANDLANLIVAHGIDNCRDSLPVSIDVQLTESEPCFSNNGSTDTTMALVTFTAVDECGNVGTSTRQIPVIRPNLREHLVKSSNATLECYESNYDGPTPGLQTGHISNGVFNPKDTLYLNSSEYQCGYGLFVQDIEVPAAGCGRKLYRYWSAIDWCHPSIGPTIIDTQLVKYTDTEAPFFLEGEGEMVMLSLGAYDCEYDITNLTPPLAGDSCSTPLVRLDSVFRIEDGLPWPVERSQYTSLDADSFHVRWIAEDLCHEQPVNDTLMQLLIIKDQTVPTALCTDRLNIAIGGHETVLYAEDVDAGSYDACGIVKKEVSRDGVNFGPTVTFTCEDVKDTIEVMFRVMDENGNTNGCWLMVFPEDKIIPICTPLPSGISYATGSEPGTTDTVITYCNEFNVAAIQDYEQPTAEELAVIGGPLPTPQDNCTGVENVELMPRVIRAGICGDYTYQRRWVARDVWGSVSLDTCTQIIIIENVEDWKITFPEDLTLVCPMQPEMVDSVIIQNGSCDRLAVSVDERMFNVVEDACFKIIRTYHIINWCNYKPGAPATHSFEDSDFRENRMLTPEDIPNLSYITYSQVIRVDDYEGPVVSIGDATECLFGSDDGKPGTYGSVEECGDDKTFMAMASDCVTMVDGQLSYEHRLYVGTEQDVINGTAVLVENSFGTGRNDTAKMTVRVQPGIHTAEFIFFDNCGNSTLLRKEYTFRDCRKPTPYLLNGLAIELSNHSGTAAIWASDFNQGSYDNCTAQEDLDLRIWHLSLGFDPPTTAQGVLDSLPTSIFFGCNDLGTQIVNIYAVDEEMNFDYASTYILVQDNMRFCDEPPMAGIVGGAITTTDGEELEGVTVNLEGGDNAQMTTAADGRYEFELPDAANYRIVPSKNTQPLNGVSTFDLVVISKHILGIEPFDSPYQYIAADVNRSSSVTAFDMVQLRKLILNIDTEFSNNTSWRFVDADYEFVTDNPAGESFPEAITINNLQGDMMTADFMGVKVGDVNDSAVPNSLVQATSRERQGYLQLNVQDREVVAGQVYQIPFRVKNMVAIEGYQFSLQTGALEVLAVNEGIASKNHFNLSTAARGWVSTSWNGSTTEERLFTLEVKANQSGQLSDFLEIAEQQLSAEAYHQDGEWLDVQLVFEKESAGVFQLFQNTPNPFTNQTTIVFELPQAGTATLTITDIQGRVVQTISDYYTEGRHELSFRASDLAAGVLYYQLETDNYIANRKMILLD